MLLATIFAAGTARGAPVTQSITVKPGWNAVFLEVEPPVTDPDAIFSTTPFLGLESIWAWNPRSSPVEFIQNPADLLPTTPYMQAYFPGQPLISNLHAIHGETAYLVKVAAGAPATQTWLVSGEPAIPRVSWKPNSFNLVGFHLDPGAEPLFVDFFAPSPAHAGQEIFVLDNAVGQWQSVTSPAAQMKRGEAFWVYCSGSSTYAGPLAVQLGSSTGLDFGTKLVEQELVVKNAGTAARNVSFTLATGATNLHAWAFDPGDLAGSWSDIMAAAPPPLPFPAGHEQRMRLGVVRNGMTPGATYVDNLTIADGEGMRIVLPVSVTGVPFSGLWVGDVVADKVRYRAGAALEETPVGSPFAYRIIVHVDDTSTVRLLREVVQLWQEGTWKPDPENLGHEIVDQPGTFVLVANPARLGEFRGSALRDGQEVGRRVSTAAFGFDAPVVAQPGASFALDGSVTFVVPLAADDATNPFFHKYHKDHMLPEQSFNVTRTITLDFGTHDGNGRLVTGVPVLSWGSTEIGGVFDEDIDLQRTTGDPQPFTVNVKGTFRLRRVSGVDQLQL